MAIYTGNQLADFCERQIGQVYWYGTCVYPCTEKLLDSDQKSAWAAYRQALRDVPEQQGLPVIWPTQP